MNTTFETEYFAVYEANKLNYDTIKSCRKSNPPKVRCLTQKINIQYQIVKDKYNIKDFSTEDHKALIKKMTPPPPAPVIQVKVKPESEECQECKKSFKNLKLHMVKTHKKFICCGCLKYKPVETGIFNISDKNTGKYCNNAMCEDCWT